MNNKINAFSWWCCCINLETTSMGVVVNGLQSRGSPTMISSLVPTTACSFLDDLMKASYVKRRRNLPPPLGRHDAMTNLTRRPQKIRRRKFLSLSLSLPPSEGCSFQTLIPSLKCVTNQRCPENVLGHKKVSHWCPSFMLPVGHL